MIWCRCFATFHPFVWTGNQPVLLHDATCSGSYQILRRSVVLSFPHVHPHFPHSLAFPSKAVSPPRPPLLPFVIGTLLFWSDLVLVFFLFILCSAFHCNQKVIVSLQGFLHALVPSGLFVINTSVHLASLQLDFQASSDDLASFQ